jgi:DNA repair protein RadA/Sms
MAKAKTLFVCSDCGHEVSKWMGQCPGCRQWNTMVEEIKMTGVKNQKTSVLTSELAQGKIEKLVNISIDQDIRVKTGMDELDRVLGGGLVQGSLTLVGGDPGIGKSTLLLQMCQEISAQNLKVLYVTGEESLKQIKIRAERLKVDGENIMLYAETSLQLIEQGIKNEQPDILIVDSIQTIYSDMLTSAPGSVSQVREVTSAMMKIAKQLNLSTFIIGHVTKDGAIAGPRVLEHMVDTVLYFEGDRSVAYRILRAVKNRFGSTNEIGVFEMVDSGLKEVTNPSEYMLTGKPEDEAGSLVTCCMEGTRPLLIEVQALVCPTNFGMARRTANGTDFNRVNLLVAVLEKKMGMQLGNYDSYVNIAGGIKVLEPALDLGIVCALASSFKNKAIDNQTIIMGEVGLTGEIRGITQCEKRVIEAMKMGFSKCVVPYANVKHLKNVQGIKVIGVKSVEEALERIF